MSQFAPIVLKDKALVDHTFSPRGIDASGVATAVESTGVPIGDKKLTLSLNRTAQKREKVNIKLTVPVVQTLTEGGVSMRSVVRTAYADVTLSFDQSSDVTERGDVLALIANALKATDVVSMVEDLEALY